MPLIPGFSQGSVNNRVDRFVLSIEQRIIYTLAKVGEAFVNAAREKTPAEGSFNDQTGDLRSSIGWVIARDGNILTAKFEGKTAEGRAQGQKTADGVLRQYSKGFVLVVVAGMEYACAVESKGKDVITGSIPAAKALLKKKIKEYKL